MGQIIEFLAFIQLRRSHADMHRPYKIPVGTFGACLLMAMPLVFILIIFYFSDIITIVLAIVCALGGVGVYYLLDIARDKKWCQFEYCVDATKGSFSYSDGAHSNDSCSSLYLLGEKSALLAGDERSRYTQRV